MHKKFGTVLDEKLINLAKEKAHQQKTTLNHIFEEALSEYLSKHTVRPEKFSPIETSFGIFKLPLKTVEAIIQEDIYDT